MLRGNSLGAIAIEQRTTLLAGRRFLFVKARGNSHQSVAVPVKSPVSHLHAIKQWHCDHRSSAKPPKGCKIDEIRRPFIDGNLFATPVLSLSARTPWSSSDSITRMD